MYLQASTQPIPPPLSPNPEDDIIAAAQTWMTKYGPAKHGPAIQILMDTISGVPGYRMGTQYDQGFIHRRFFSERISSNHVIDYDTLVSHFWQGVFKKLKDAVPKGTLVMVRNTAVGIGVPFILVDTADKRTTHGRSYEERETRVGPIKYLQMQGITAARKYVNSCYKMRLRQSCGECGRTGSLGVLQESKSECPKCKSDQSVMLAGVMRKRQRRCLGCQHIRLCVMKRVCGQRQEAEDGSIVYEGGCGSVDVQVIQSEEFMTDHESWDATLGEDGHDPEVHMLKDELERDVQEFTQACLNAMPRDARDPMGDSQSRKILRILVDPKDGTEICKQCVAGAPLICIEKCGTKGCNHTQGPDPKISCGAHQFSMGECVNYSKKIGEFLGYTASLANRRVTKVRKHAIEFAAHSGRRYVTAKYINRRLADNA